MGIISDWISGARRADTGRARTVELGMIGNELGRALDADDMEAAADVFERAFRNRSRELGSMHPETLRYRHGLLRIRALLEIPGIADQVKLLVGDCTTSLESHHALTFVARTTAADILAAQGRPADAERALLAVVADALPHHGTGSVVIRSAQARLAQILTDTGRPGEALALAEQVIQACGPRSAEPPMPAALHAWASAALALGRFGEAEGAVIRIFEIQDQRRLDGHPPLLVEAAPASILSARIKLARGYPAKAEPLARQVAYDVEQSRGGGERHSSAIGARLVQARCQLALGQAATAEEIAALTTEVASRHHGPEHPLTLTARFVRATAVATLAGAGAAAAEHAAVLAVRARVLGPEHPDTIASQAAVTPDSA